MRSKVKQVWGEGGPCTVRSHVWEMGGPEVSLRVHVSEGTGPVGGLPVCSCAMHHG